MNRTAKAQWRGNLKEGGGYLTTESLSLLDTPYNFQTRFETQSGTNPEELIAAAHAACFSMALSGEIQKLNVEVKSIEVGAQVSLENKKNGDWSISKVHLDVSVFAPGLDDLEFRKASEITRRNCPVSKVLNAEITMKTKLLKEEHPAPQQEAG